MIASLCGKLEFKGVDQVVVLVGGVGYQVHVSLQTLAELPAAGAEVRLLCFTHVREDALQLFGFSADAERQAFELLKGVSGIGPKLALTVLSGMPVGELARAICGAETARLVKIPGIGKKTAERLVLELRDRMAALAAGGGDQPPPGGAASPEVETLIEALIGLGYKRPLAERAIERVCAKPGRQQRPELLLRQALAVIQELR